MEEYGERKEVEGEQIPWLAYGVETPAAGLALPFMLAYPAHVVPVRELYQSLPSLAPVAITYRVEPTTAAPGVPDVMPPAKLQVASQDPPDGCAFS